MKHSIVVFGIILSFTLNLFPFLFIGLLNYKTNLGFPALFYLSRAWIFIILILIYFYSLRVENQRLILWQDEKYSLIFLIKSVALIILTIISGALIIGAILRVLHVNSDLKRLSELVDFFKANTFSILFFSLFAAVSEEVIFRGYMIPRLELVFKKPFLATIISSVLFGFLHLGYNSVQQVLVPTFIGIVFALFYQKYRNIKILILCHFIWDASILLILSHR